MVSGAMVSNAPRIKMIIAREGIFFCTVFRIEFGAK
jgi:hypothetical protein